MNQIEHELKKVSESKTAKRIIKVGVVIVSALIIFQAGQFVGLKRAEFSFRMADNYYNNFDGRLERGGMIKPSSRNMMADGRFTESHGAAGKIIKISLPTVTVSTADNFEKTIYISSSTVIREFRELIASSSLKVDDIVVAIGEPTMNGQIEAKLIRVMPEPIR